MTKGKIQVIFKKEDIKPDLLEGKVAVVFDILFATSTITAAIAHGAVSVIPVFSAEQAREKAAQFTQPYLMAGEDRGRTIEGFHPPLHTHISPLIQGKHLILTTTNGTVALTQANKSANLYASSLLNNPAMAKHLYQKHKHETIVLICSGSSGSYTMEDFYGAGSLISFMQELGDWELSDAAATAFHFYESSRSSKQLLTNCRIGQLLMNYGVDQREIEFAAQEGVFDTVLVYDPEEGQIKEGHYASS
ncbi:2-phosphosulfolactate phosphatase [Halobacillus litoralis]|uniref:2-phosphosulfolactate phosphatase n=1 Tax=Halobacillus litoralis TaxID=45668 RepID=UPI001CFD0AE5|nr:2-phosphosulfolactate phosphatase [Halobacillus litoralis]